MNKTKSKTKPATNPATAAIAAARSTLSTPEPPKPGWQDCLRELCEYNDSVGGSRGRVSAATTIEILRKDYGWSGNCVQTLNGLCRQRLGRQTYAKA